MQDTFAQAHYIGRLDDRSGLAKAGCWSLDLQEIPRAPAQRLTLLMQQERCLLRSERGAEVRVLVRDTSGLRVTLARMSAELRGAVAGLPNEITKEQGSGLPPQAAAHWICPR